MSQNRSQKTGLWIAVLATMGVTNTVISAQAKIKEGYVKYEVSDVKGEGMATMALKNSKQIYFFSKKHNKVDAQMAGGMVRTTVVGDNITESSVLYTDGAVGKKMVNYTKAERDKQDSKMGKYKITTDVKVTKNILGYVCTKQILRGEDGEIIVFTTDKITPAKNPFRQFGDMKGFPLEFMVNQGGVVATFTAKELGGKIGKTEFDIPKAGYEKMTMQQFNKMLGKLSDGE